MRILKYTNSMGESITFKNDSSFIITQINGLGDVDADVQTNKAPFQDGTTFINSELQPRYIDFEIFFKGRNDTDISEKRSLLSRIFNPKLGIGKFELKYGEVQRELYATSEHVPNFPQSTGNNRYNYQKALIDLIAPNPYWQSTAIVESATFEGLFEFPFEGEFQFGIQRDERIVYNDSDAPAPLQVTFYGPATTPQIKNLTTGEFIRINQSLGENDKLLIDTTDGVKSVIFEDENGQQTNVFNWLDLDSTFFKLIVGENEISCMCVSSNLSKDFEITYNKMYNAI